MAQTHEKFDRQDDIIVASERNFGLVFAAVFAIIAGMRLWRGHSDAMWWLMPAFVFAALGLFWTAPLVPLNRLWARFGRLLHAIVNPIVLALLFALAIVPIGIMMRLAGKDPLRLRRDPSASTYWLPYDSTSRRANRMEDQF
jgi:hypothetical protein